MEKSPIIERIIKAMALAKDRAGTPEGETAARIARNMMDVHAIEMADLDLAQAEKVDPLEKQHFDIGKRQTWIRNLMQAIGRHCTLRTTFTIGNHYMTLFGHRHDIEVAQYLFTVITRQLEKAYEVYRDTEIPHYSLSEKLRARNDFLLSAVQGVERKLEQIRAQSTKQSEAQHTGTAMILVSRADRVLAFYEQVKGKVKTVSNGRQDWNAAGYLAGKSVNLTPALDSRGSSTRSIKG